MKIYALGIGLIVTSFASAATVVAPNALESAEGSSQFSLFNSLNARRYQLIINSSQLTSLAGMNLTGFSLRMNGSTTAAAWPPSNYTHNFFNVKLSQGVAPADRSLTYADNIVGTQTDVRTGNWTVAAGAFTNGSSPNAFGPMIDFDTPYLYTGGNLAVDMFFGTNSSGSSPAFDALLNSSDPLANTQVGATWSSYTEFGPPTEGSSANPLATQWHAAAVPEPFSMVAMGAGLLALARRRRRA